MESRVDRQFLAGPLSLSTFARSSKLFLVLGWPEGTNNSELACVCLYYALLHQVWQCVATQFTMFALAVVTAVIITLLR